MSAMRAKLALATCLALGGLVQSAPSQAHSLEQIRAVEREYARQTGGAIIPDNQLNYYLDRMDAGWPMSRVSSDIANLRTPVARSSWRPAPDYVAEDIICTSVGSKYRECAIPWRGQALLATQISRTACIEGRTWGQKAGAVWVNGGCRATFAVVRPTNANNNGNMGNNGNNGMRTVVCNSNQGSYRECPTGMRNPVVLLNRLNNSAACVEGRSWGNKPGVVWVDNGCRAQFTTQRRADREQFNRDPNYAVNCTDTASGRTICDWDHRYGNPVIQQQSSSDACVEGRGWGYTANGELWVDSGCRARFGYR